MFGSRFTIIRLRIYAKWTHGPTLFRGLRLALNTCDWAVSRPAKKTSTYPIASRQQRRARHAYSWSRLVRRAERRHLEKCPAPPGIGVNNLLWPRAPRRPV